MRLNRHAKGIEVSAEELAEWLAPPSRWRRLRWRLEAAAYAGLEFALGCLPLGWVARIGRAAGALACVFAKRRRRTVERNLRVAFAGEPEGEARVALAREVFRRAGANLFTALATARLSPARLASAVEVRDEHIYRAALARGKGVVMVLAHMGNWEALAQWFPRLLPPGVAGATVYRPLNNPVLNARVSASRKRMGVELFSKQDNPLGMASFLRKGGVLGVLADQRAGKIGELVPFFGRLTSCSPIPAILARRTGAALVGISLSTLAPGRWELRFHAYEAGADGAAEPVGEPLTVGVMALVERMMRVSPTDVFWLQDRWRVERRDPGRVWGKTPRDGLAVSAKRRRALLWATGPGRDGAAIPPFAEPADVDLETDGARAGESALAALRRIDARAALPLDYVVGGDAEVRKACRALGLVWTAGAAKA